MAGQVLAFSQVGTECEIFKNSSHSCVLGPVKEAMLSSWTCGENRANLVIQVTKRGHQIRITGLWPWPLLKQATGLNCAQSGSRMSQSHRGLVLVVRGSWYYMSKVHTDYWSVMEAKVYTGSQRWTGTS